VTKENHILNKNKRESHSPHARIFLNPYMQGIWGDEETREGNRWSTGGI
jgi:hypothetical protein